MPGRPRTSRPPPWPQIAGLALLALTIAANERVIVDWGAPLLLPQIAVLAAGVAAGAARRPYARAWQWAGALGAGVALGIVAPLGWCITLLVGVAAVRALRAHAVDRRRAARPDVEAPLVWGRAFALADAQTVLASFVGVLTYNGGAVGARLAMLSPADWLPPLGLAAIMVAVAAALRTRTVWSVLFNLVVNAGAVGLVCSGLVYVPAPAVGLMLATTALQVWLYHPILAAVWSRAQCAD